MLPPYCEMPIPLNHQCMDQYYMFSSSIISALRKYFLEKDGHVGSILEHFFPLYNVHQISDAQ